jgi:hypothetical protein
MYNNAGKHFTLDGDINVSVNHNEEKEILATSTKMTRMISLTRENNVGKRSSRQQQTLPYHDPSYPFHGTVI